MLPLEFVCVYTLQVARLLKIEKVLARGLLRDLIEFGQLPTMGCGPG
jgi:hypothetical protein